MLAGNEFGHRSYNRPRTVGVRVGAVSARARTARTRTRIRPRTRAQAWTSVRAQSRAPVRTQARASVRAASGSGARAAVRGHAAARHRAAAHSAAQQRWHAAHCLQSVPSCYLANNSILWNILRSSPHSHGRFFNTPLSDEVILKRSYGSKLNTELHFSYFQ